MDSTCQVALNIAENLLENRWDNADMTKCTHIVHTHTHTKIEKQDTKLTKKKIMRFPLEKCWMEKKKMLDGEKRIRLLEMLQ